MKLTPNDLALIATVVVVCIWVAVQDDPRWVRFVRRWRNRNKRVPAPDEHSAGIMTSRRDINTGNWT